MSRAEKARAEKRKGKAKQRIAILLLSLGLLAVFALVVMNMQNRESLFAEDPFWMVQDRSVAVVDFFELTHVFIFVKEDIAIDRITAAGRPLGYNQAEAFWEGALSGYVEGDELTIVAEKSGETVGTAILRVEPIIGPDED